MYVCVRVRERVRVMWVYTEEIILRESVLKYRTHVALFICLYVRYEVKLVIN